MMSRRPTAPIAVSWIFLLASVASGHQLIPNDGSATSAEAAIRIEDPGISRVIYHEITDDAPTVWLTFTAPAEYRLWAQVAVPYIDRYADLRPAAAIIGPGLPVADLPFDLPEGLGAIVLDSTGAEGVFFDEPFTGTQSWIFREEEVTLGEAGTYYMVGYVPSGDAGKMWMALGTREEFSLADIITINDVIAEVRAFHEVSDQPGPPCFLFTLIAGGLMFTGVRLVQRRARRMTSF